MTRRLRILAVAAGALGLAACGVASDRRRGQTRRMTLGDDGRIFDGPNAHPGFTRFRPR